VLSLLLGPLLILLLFGLSYSGDLPEFRVAVVVPPDMPEDQVARLKESFSGNLALVSMDSDEEAAMEMLRQGQANWSKCCRPGRAKCSQGRPR
jgi:ABC-2 type transport system permease protein